MTFPSEQADALLRPGIQRAAAWLTITMVTVIFVTTALLVWAARPGILAERDRAFKRDSTLITENLASVLQLPATGPAPQSQPSVFLTPT